jgi:hypothetical protein
MSFELSPPLRRTRQELFRDGVLPMSAHEGSREDFLLRHERDCSRYDRLPETERTLFRDELLSRIADERNLLLAVEAAVRKGNKAPGPNGQHLWSLWRGNRRHVLETVRELRRALADGTYRPGPVRRIDVPKASGNGTRPIEIMSWQDLVVQRAIVQIIRPLMDSRLGQLSLGGRPGRQRMEAMAFAKAIAEVEDRKVAIVADLRNAFTSVPLQPLIEQVRRDLGTNPATQLIETIIRGNGRHRGVAQGAPLSMIFLDVYLDAQLDRRWRNQAGNPPLIRWVDDLLILCSTRDEAEASYQRLQTILQPTGMQLKGTAGRDIVDLTQGKVEWLGAEMALENGELAFHADIRFSTRLVRKLEEAIEEADGAIRCHQTLLSVFRQAGSCFTTPNRNRIVEQAIAAAMTAGADEPSEAGEILRVWEGEYARYAVLVPLVREIYQRRSQYVGPGQGSASGHLNRSVQDLDSSGSYQTNVRPNGERRRLTTTLVLRTAQQLDGIGCWAVAIVPQSRHRPVTFRSGRVRGGGSERLWFRALEEGIRLTPYESDVRLDGLPAQFRAQLLAALRESPSVRGATRPSSPSVDWKRVLKAIRAGRIQIPELGGRPMEVSVQS